jgi:hypothetical protein
MSCSVSCFHFNWAFGTVLRCHFGFIVVQPTCDCKRGVCLASGHYVRDKNALFRWRASLHDQSTTHCHVARFVCCLYYALIRLGSDLFIFHSNHCMNCKRYWTSPETIGQWSIKWGACDIPSDYRKEINYVGLAPISSSSSSSSAVQLCKSPGLPSEPSFGFRNNDNFYGMRLSASQPTPNLEDQGIRFSVGHHLWPVRQGRPCQ